MNEFFQRLKQRKLVQWAIGYVGATFALLQGLLIVDRSILVGQRGCGAGSPWLWSLAIL